VLGRHTSVERYAWYPWNTNNELVLSGNLTLPRIPVPKP